MSSSKSKSLKRLSLLQSPSSLSSPSSSTFGSPSVASKRFSLPDELVGAISQPSPSLSESSSRTNTRQPQETVKKDARRQSSIYYVSHERGSECTTREARTPVDDQKFSKPQESKDEDTSSRAKDKRRSMSAIDHQTAPLTLAEKHADLLRFIAQKESRCLELRSQLATEEAELLALKSKWERIVNRRIKGESPSNISSDLEPLAQSNVLTGLKEGVQGVGKLLAHLSDIGTPITETDPSHASNSSVSTVATTSSMGMSQSSISSLGTIEDSDSPDSQNAYADSLGANAKRLSLSTPVRRRPYEPSSPGTPSPPILTPQTPYTPRTPYSPSFTYNQAGSPAPPRSKIVGSTDAQKRHAKRHSVASGSLPLASSIPGMSVAPLASWVEGVGKRLIGQVMLVTETSSSKHGPGSGRPVSAIPASPRPSQLGARVVDLSTPDSPSLLDDDEASSAQWAGTTLSPERSESGSSPMVCQKDPGENLSRKELKCNTGNLKVDDDDSEEWNW